MRMGLGRKRMGWRLEILIFLLWMAQGKRKKNHVLKVTKPLLLTRFNWKMMWRWLR